MMNSKRARNAYDGMTYSAKAMRQQYNPYKEALLNPISGPLVGVPVTVPVDTHRARLKATGTITVTGGSLTVSVNPVTALCNDTFLTTGTSPVSIGAINYVASNGFPIGQTPTGTFTSNAQYTRSQFAGLTNSSNVRGRVVAAALRICNVSAANTRNGVFTTFQDPQHLTLHTRTSSAVATDPKARQYNGGTENWHVVTYHPVEPEEAEGWVWDPAVGPQSGVKTGSYVPQLGVPDATAADNYPGYMNIFWNGDAVSQTFQVELYVIAEYVGGLVTPLLRANDVHIDMAQEAREHAEDATSHMATPTEGAEHTGHPNSDTHPSRAQRALQFAASEAPVAKGLRKAAKMGAVTAAGYFAGPAGASAAAKYLLSPEATTQLARGLETASDIYSARRARSQSAPRSSYTTPTSQQRLSYSRGRSATRR